MVPLLDWLLVLPRRHRGAVVGRDRDAARRRRRCRSSRTPSATAWRGAARKRADHGQSVGLKLKFGDAGLALMPDVERKEKAESLKAILDAIGPETTIDDVKHYSPEGSPRRRRSATTIECTSRRGTVTRPPSATFSTASTFPSGSNRTPFSR